jgi:hypothetical protein
MLQSQGWSRALNDVFPTAALLIIVVVGVAAVASDGGQDGCLTLTCMRIHLNEAREY